MMDRKNEVLAALAPWMGGLLALAVCAIMIMVGHDIGAGGEHGLGLEAWFQDEDSNAIVRTQATGGATYVRSGNEAYVYSYITPADFTLSRDVVYTLHLTVIPEGHVTRVLGELWDESGMLQRGTLHVTTAMHLGVVGRAVLGRTPGESGDSIQATYLGGV